MVTIKSTLCFFETTMPIRVNGEVLDTEIFNFWETNGIAQKIYDSSKGKKRYILHDGPPYANGPIHLGHAYNKIMKDIVIRSRIMMGYDAYTTPGWDCHGLPIEHKVSLENPTYNAIEMKKACRQYADKWVTEQKKSFKKLGVLMDWENPYKTMNFKYQAEILRNFGKLVEKGYINRSNKTVPWCCGCKTALASAEIEYKNRKDPSLYVLFLLKNEYNSFINLSSDILVFLVIWTTTPWTLPLNCAVMLKKNAEYLVLKNEDTYLIIGKNCLAHFSKITKKEYMIIAEFNSESLKNSFVFHPFESNFVPVLLEDSVEMGEGTACVHCAPGCGPIDYEVGIKNGLAIYSPISNSGYYTKDCHVTELVGKSIIEGRDFVITTLESKNKLFYKGVIEHSYPHCWRCREGLIFRATPQWFCNLEKDGFKEKVVDAIDTIEFYPVGAKSFLKSTVSSRWEWCLSRQRSWGVPIVALLKNNSNEYWIDSNFINTVADKFETKGMEYWDEVNLADLKNVLPSDLDLNFWHKEKDILDVWFDSGISHSSVLIPENDFPADVYLEGVDQHRGWFQSSLLTSVALYNKAPMKSIISCGHTVDEKGQKMSKSLGNGIEPEEVIKKIGLDGFRAWVSSVNLGGDIVVSKKIFDNVQEVYRKIRNTCRFAVKNLVDFDPKKDMILVENMNFLDQFMIKKLYEYNLKVISAYQNIEFAQVFHILIDLCNSFLSSFYFDLIKDVLYCDEQNGIARRSAQSVLYIVLDTITKLSAPILVNTTEDITNHYKSNKKESIHREEFSHFSCLDFFKDEGYILSSYDLLSKENITDCFSKMKIINESEYMKFWNLFLLFRQEVFKKIEEAREIGMIKQGIESTVVVSLGQKNQYTDMIEFFKKFVPFSFTLFLNQFLLVSGSDVIFNNTDLCEIVVKKHTGIKCERCWKYFYSDKEDIFCHRCHIILEKLKN